EIAVPAVDGHQLLIGVLNEADRAIIGNPAPYAGNRQPGEYLFDRIDLGFDLDVDRVPAGLELDGLGHRRAASRARRCPQQRGQRKKGQASDRNQCFHGAFTMAARAGSYGSAGGVGRERGLSERPAGGSTSASTASSISVRWRPAISANRSSSRRWVR